MPTGGAERFLARADFSFGWSGLITTDRRFDWQANVAFDIDVYRSRVGRLRFRGDYDAVLGRERRRYDLNQGNYGFEVAGSVLTRHAEIAMFSQHVSRHLVDRDNVPAISWNTLGGRIRTAWTPGGGFDAEVSPAAPRVTTVTGELEVSRAMQQAFVD